ncbi:MAG: 7-cyano-7-deazaguanine synthase [Candidatus Omnitrophica bacterium]|nr:7-cyano-7-deazaguanine synthase [Candidatus Omnitrophota bacterium]MBU1932544.1 7-cyano-7-deazaguanine synthase [Candidatus Omnitrophota bacterium]
MNNKAVALFSGGLDSMLAIKLMMEQGVEVYALNFLTIFCTCTSKGCMHQATKAAKELGVPLKVMNITREYMEIVRNPKYDRGRNMNPCIDCRIFTFVKAREYMEEIDASFVVTGEVLGQRPMSQRRQAMEIIERESGLRGLIVRPLSASLFEPTMPEKQGIVDRERLLDIQGRQRERQFKLAEELGINDYPCPAGGCLLTDKGFSSRLKDLFKYKPDYTLSDLHLLKIGRQFRISEKTKLIVGRNEKENKALLNFAEPDDYIFDVVGIPSPIGLARGDLDEKEIESIASIMTRYSDALTEKAKVFYKILPSEELNILTVEPATETTLQAIRI